MAIKPSIKPINKTIYVEKSGVREIDSKDVSIDIVGQKAFGLSCVFKPWTLPYFVISAELFNEYKL